MIIWSVQITEWCFCCRDNNASYTSLPPPSGRSTQSQAAAPVPSINTDDPDAYVEKLQRNWAKGPRLEFLNSQLPLYSASLSEGSSKASERLDSIINGYFQLFPWRLKVTEDADTPYNPLVHPPIEPVCDIEVEQKRRKVIAMRKVCFCICFHFTDAFIF